MVADNPPGPNDDDELRNAVGQLEGPTTRIIAVLQEYRDFDRQRPDDELDAELDEAATGYETATNAVAQALSRFDGAEAWSRRAGLAFLDVRVIEEAAYSIRFQEGTPVVHSVPDPVVNTLLAQVGGRPNIGESGQEPLPVTVGKAIDDIVTSCAGDLVDVTVATSAPIGVGVSGLLDRWPEVVEAGQRFSGGALNVLRRLVARLVRSAMGRVRELAQQIPTDVLRRATDSARGLSTYGIEVGRENVAEMALHRILGTEALKRDLRGVMVRGGTRRHPAALEAASQAATDHTGKRKWLPWLAAGLGGTVGITVTLAGLSMPLWLVLSAALVIYSLLLAVDYLDVVRPGLFVGVRNGVEAAMGV